MLLHRLGSAPWQYEGEGVLSFFMQYFRNSACSALVAFGSSVSEFRCRNNA